MGVCVIEQQIVIVATHHRIQCTDEAIKTNGYNRARYYTLHNITNDLLKQLIISLLTRPPYVLQKL